MELKINCECGQHYKFDVEPADGQMPFTVNCPACNQDGTAVANTLIAANLAGTPPPLPAPAPIGLKINRHAPEAAAPPALETAEVRSTPPPIGALRPLSTDKKSRPPTDGEFSRGRGIAGALIGTAAGCGLMFAFWMWTHFRFPFMGIAVGAAAGYGARWLARGTETTLGIITAVIAGLAVTGTFVLMYGEFAPFNIISIVICAGVAYRASSE